MYVVIVGHVDHGKSTIIGRLLADTGSLPEGKLEQVKALCARTAKPFEYAFLLDALKDEQAQGITIDAARVFFRTPKRRYYIILDAPGHVEFLKNMVTGAARAEAALLVIDAKRRHPGELAPARVPAVDARRATDRRAREQDGSGRLPAGGVRRAVVEEYRRVPRDGSASTPAGFIPVIGRDGDNIAERSATMSLVHGPDRARGARRVSRSRAKRSDAAVPHAGAGRLQVHRSTATTGGSSPARSRAAACASATRWCSIRRERRHASSRSRRSIRSAARPRPKRARRPASRSTQQIYVARGEMATLAARAAAAVSTRFRASIFWLGKARS